MYSHSYLCHSEPLAKKAGPLIVIACLTSQIQLSAYPNHIGKNIKDLDYFMSTHLRGAPSAFFPALVARVTHTILC